MKQSIWIGVASALITGIAIGVQALFSNRGGQAIGTFRTGLLSNLGSGFFALLLAIIFSGFRFVQWQGIPHSITVMLLISGGIGVGIIMGAAFSLRFTGITAGVATIIIGQLLVSTIADTIGWGGIERIPVTPQRILGLLVMGLGVYLLLPRK